MNAADMPAPGDPWVDGLTIGRVLRETARKHPQRDAYVFRDTGVRATWRQLDEQADRVAAALLGSGIEPGSHFGVWATNVPEWVQLQFGAARAGVVLVNVNPAYRTAELRYALRQSEVVGLALVDSFRKSDYVATLGEACPELAGCEPGSLCSEAFPSLRWVVSLRGATPAGAVSWQEFLALADDKAVGRARELEDRLDCNDAINIQYTSGTTGEPKGAMLSHRNILLNAYYAGQGQDFTPEDRILLPVPLYHCFGCVLGTLCAAVHGCAMVFPGEGFAPDSALAAIQAERCTAVYGVPTMFIAMIEHEDYPDTDTSSLRTGIMAGSPCPIELMRKVTGQMGAREITIGYGQTEAAPLITQTRTDDPLEQRVGTVGRCIPGFEAKVIDPDTGATLPDGQQGELCGRGHGVMLGYYNLPDKSAEAVDADGWLHTGDLAVRQPDGYFRITGRLRDMIIRGGENIYPREVEERIYQHPAVEEVQVVGIPDRRFGEEVLAWVKLRGGQTAGADDLCVFCKETLSHYKIPRRWKFVDSFPTTVTGKIQKFRMRQDAIAEYGLQDVAATETA